MNLFRNLLPIILTVVTQRKFFRSFGAVMYTVLVVISQKQCKIEMLLLQTDSK